jgi:tRNA(Ile)-lysidine synthase
VNKFCRNTITNWRKLKLPFDSETFVLAVSGGADSVSLLAVFFELKQLGKLKLEFIVAHFDHNLRGKESDADADLVKFLAEKYSFQLVIEKANLSKSGNLEQIARNARYDFLARTALEHNAFGILTAHNQNDQAETFLMNLIRGSGLDGLSAMPEIRDVSSESKTKLIRPFLSWAKRIDTENYCNECEIGFREDSMNSDENFLRVKIRKKLLPFLRELNPKIIETISQTVKHLRFESQNSSEDALEIGDELSSSNLATLGESKRYRAIRKWLMHHRGNLRSIGMKHVESIDRLSRSRKSGREVELPGFERVIKKEGMLLFRKQRLKKP